MISANTLHDAFSGLAPNDLPSFGTVAKVLGGVAVAEMLGVPVMSMLNVAGMGIAAKKAYDFVDDVRHRDPDQHLSLGDVAKGTGLAAGLLATVAGLGHLSNPNTHSYQSMYGAGQFAAQLGMLSAALTATDCANHPEHAGQHDVAGAAAGVTAGIAAGMPSPVAGILEVAESAWHLFQQSQHKTSAAPIVA